jgi:hypothetical protein
MYKYQEGTDIHHFIFPKGRRQSGEESWALMMILMPLSSVVTIAAVMTVL